MKYFNTLFAVVMCFLTASCSSMHVQTVSDTPAQQVLVNSSTATGTTATAQQQSAQEEPTAPVVSDVPAPVTQVIAGSKSYTCYNGDGVAVTLTSESEIAAAILTASCPPPAAVVAQIDQLDEKQLSCMAAAIYHEARGEPERGQAAVGWVVRNRMDHPRYPKTVCGVVYDSNPRGCQFSWVCDHRSDAVREAATYARVVAIASRVIRGDYPNPVGKAIYFDGYVHGSKHKPGQVVIGKQRYYGEGLASDVSKKRRSKRRRA